MNREKFFDMFGSDIEKTHWVFHNECDCCRKPTKKAIFVKLGEKQRDWSLICKECFCETNIDYIIEMWLSDIDNVEEIERND